MTTHPSAPWLTRRRLLAGAAAVAAGLSLGSCQQDARTYSLGTAENRGFFFDFGQSLAAAVGRSDAGFTLNPQITGGSVENIPDILAGRVDLALALADVAAANAERDKLRAVGRVYLNYLQFAVPADSPIRTLADLRGRTVSLGGSSATARAGKLLLAAAGLSESDVQVRAVPITAVLDALASGEVDAALFAGGVPHPAMDPGGGRGPAQGIRLIDLSGYLPDLQEAYGPVYQQVRLPAGLYGAREEVGSIGIASLLLARADLPDDVVGRIVDVLINRSAELVPPGTVGVQYLDTRSLIYTSGVPLHPGAAAAYRRHHK
ncbi:TRAP transporter TAXI family solute receptor [Arthrobacter pascens]|uniref:TAXI family TRAP transporter solute-binding subunit n=1 Tax=Arthrobacter pascens TaxID=1677 RepID=UPI00286208B9|nr:TAXI family TRAP transporter solute-binding subunit [Arthrobacter pascens]MDR6558543.1 TRAP transporter TAXI family solute receptor [Arthrobacter pascens]